MGNSIGVMVTLIWMAIVPFGVFIVSMLLGWVI